MLLFIIHLLCNAFYAKPSNEIIFGEKLLCCFFNDFVERNCLILRILYSCVRLAVLFVVHTFYYKDIPVYNDYDLYDYDIMIMIYIIIIL